MKLVVLLNLAVVLFVVLQSVNSSNITPFNCVLRGHNCKNKVPCDTITGLCACQSEWGRFDCSMPIPVTTCNRNGGCSNGGTCSGKKCYCTAGYTGTTCKDIRVFVSACTTTDITPNVHPFKIPFVGYMYVKGQKSNTNCLLEKSPAKGPAKYTKVLAWTDCGGATTSDYTDPTSGLVVGQLKSFDIVVQHDPTMLVSKDYSITYACVVMNDGSTQIQDAEVREVNTDTGYVVKDIEVTDTGVTVAVTNAAGNVLTSVVSMGTPVQLLVSLDPLKGFSDVRVTSVHARPTATSSIVLDLVQGECAGKDYESFITSFTQDSSTKSVSLSFNAFAFTGETSVYLTTKVRLCTGTCTDVTCPAGSTPVDGVDFMPAGKRRKRTSDLSDDSLDEDEVVDVWFQVDNPYSTRPQNDTCSTSGQEQEVVYISLLAILSVLCFLSVVTTIHQGRQTLVYLNILRKSALPATE